MRRVFDIVILFKEYLLLALYMVIAIALMAANDTSQIRTIRSLTVALIGFLQDAFGFIPNYFELARENTALREEQVRASRFEMVPDLDMAGARGAAIAALERIHGR